MWELTGIYLSINSRFKNCNVPGPCVDIESSDVTFNNGFMAPSSNSISTNKIESILLYPNPTNDVINLVSKDWLENDVTVTIFNNLGAVVGQKSFNDI